MTAHQPAAGPAAENVGPGPAVPVLIKRLDQGLPLPARAHPGDAGVDLCTAIDVVLAPGERALVPTGVAVALPEGYAGFVHPRSGLAARHGVTIVNAPGTVDAGYRGEIKVTLLNTDRAEPVRFERRDGKAFVNGMTRPGTMTVIPAGSSSRWDIYQPLSVVQLYLPQTTLARVAHEAGTAASGDLVEQTAHPDPITSRLLLSALDALEGSAALDALFRHQLTDLLATRLIAAYSGSQPRFEPVIGGLSPKVLARAIERLRSDSDADVSLAALAADAGVSRFHFCRAFKESTGLSPHAWLRQHRLEQAMNMLRDADASVVSVAAALGYSSQTAFAAAFRKMTGETPSEWRRRMR